MAGSVAGVGLGEEKSVCLSEEWKALCTCLCVALGFIDLCFFSREAENPDFYVKSSYFEL